MRPVQTAVKALLISRSSASNLHHRRRLHDEFEILDPCAAAAGKLQLVGPFGDDLEAHVLQHGQQVRDRDRVLTAEDLEEELVLAARIGPVDVQVQALRFLVARLEEGHVDARRPRREKSSV